MDEIAELLEVNPGASSYYAAREMHYGRLEWLAEHIRRSDFQIDPTVARKILAMIEGSDPSCYFELKAVKRSDLPSRFMNPQLRMFRDINMAVDLARRCRFKRGKMKAACEKVGETFRLSAAYVAKRTLPHRQHALDVIDEEEAQARYRRGKTDILGRSI